MLFRSSSAKKIPGMALFVDKERWVSVMFRNVLIIILLIALLLQNGQIRNIESQLPNYSPGSLGIVNGCEMTLDGLGIFATSDFFWGSNSKSSSVLLVSGIPMIEVRNGEPRQVSTEYGYATEFKWGSKGIRINKIGSDTDQQSAKLTLRCR
jgi:hypothetical protein